MSLWWSWVLAANGMFGLYLMADHPKIGPWFNIAGQSVWFTYGIVTRQWGFLISSVVYIYIFGRMLRRTRKSKPVSVYAASQDNQ